jgi:hypothetical protein
MPVSHVIAMAKTRLGFSIGMAALSRCGRPRLHCGFSARVRNCGWPQMSRASRGVVTDIIRAQWDFQFDDDRRSSRLPCCIAYQGSVASENLKSNH